MRRVGTLFWWAVIVGAVTVPYVSKLNRRPPPEPSARADELPLVRRKPPSWPLHAGLAGGAVGLGAVLLWIRSGASRRPLFHVASPETAQKSLAAFALVLAVPWIPGIPGSGVARPAVLLAVVFWLVRSLSRRVLEEAWGLRWESLRKDLLYGVAGYLVILPAQALLGFGVHRMPYPEGVVVLAGVFGLFQAIVLAPVLEEVLYRGAFQAHLRRHMSWLGATLVVALVFALAHHPLRWNVLLSHFLAGCVLCVLREWRGSLVAPMVTHFLLNAPVAIWQLKLLDILYR
jgi:membrane protease YdiL (CAAX protease family)